MSQSLITLTLLGVIGVGAYYIYKTAPSSGYLAANAQSRPGEKLIDISNTIVHTKVDEYIGTQGGFHITERTSNGFVVGGWDELWDPDTNRWVKVT